jgi:hypothetical protein
MRNKAKKNSTQSSGWRKLTPKSSKRPATFPSLRKRLGVAGRILILVFALGVFGLGFWWVDRFIGSAEGSFDLTGPGAPIAKVAFSSDGVLGKGWFANWFGPLRNRSLMEIDIDDLRRELENEPQIESARVAREFPSTLRIEIKERSPLLVLRLRNRQKGSFDDWIVGSQGTLYRGEGYSRAQLSTLPSLAVPSSSLRRLEDGEGFENLPEISMISPLLELAKREYPSLYRDWKVVSYDLETPDGPGAHIRVTSGKVKDLRFAPREYATQMKRLKYILLEPDFRRQPVIKSINLCHDRSVFAQL